VAGADAQRPELVEREDPVGKPGHHLVDVLQLGVVVRVGGRLPGPGALEADVVLVQDDPHPFASDTHRPHGYQARVVMTVAAAEVRGEFADAPVRERQPESLRPGCGRGHDHLDVLVGDPPRTSTTPAWCQHGQPLGVERVNHVAHRVRIGGHQPGDRWYRRPGRRRHDDQCTAVPHGVVTAPAYQPEQVLALVGSQPAGPDRSGHDTPRSTPKIRMGRNASKLTDRPRRVDIDNPAILQGQRTSASWPPSRAGQTGRAVLAGAAATLAPAPGHDEATGVALRAIISRRGPLPPEPDGHYQAVPFAPSGGPPVTFAANLYSNSHPRVAVRPVPPKPDARRRTVPPPTLSRSRSACAHESIRLVSR
jgi:hypothetical protein